MRWGGLDAVGAENREMVILERVRHFYLIFRQIRPSEFFGARRKVVLCRETYAWAPVLGFFDNFHEVRDLSYLSFTLYLIVF